LPDISQLARAILEEATGEALVDHASPKEPTHKKNPAAVALGKLGGKNGSIARRGKLTHEQRQERARRAAQAR
jgi:hypothetical protein